MVEVEGHLPGSVMVGDCERSQLLEHRTLAGPEQPQLAGHEPRRHIVQTKADLGWALLQLIPPAPGKKEPKQGMRGRLSFCVFWKEGELECWSERKNVCAHVCEYLCEFRAVRAQG